MKRVIFALAICLFIGGTALAGFTNNDWVDMDYTGHTGNSQGQFSTDGGSSWSGTVYAAQLNYTATSTSGRGDDVPSPLHTYCIDLTDNAGDALMHLKELTSGDLNADITSFEADALKELWGESYDSISTNADRARFQLAIWEIVFEDYDTNGWDITDGDFQARNFGVDPSSLLSSVSDEGYDAFESNLIALHNGQDILGTIPAPGAIMLGSIGIGLVGYLRRRRTI